MKKYKVYPETTPVCFITSTIVEWLDVFREERYFRLILDSLNFCRENKGLLLLGLVIMPNHIHLMVSCRDGGDLAGIVRDFKRHSSTRIAEMLEQDKNGLWLHVFRKAGEKQGCRIKVWKDDYRPVSIVSERWFRQKLNYMHANPVRKGFVLNPEDWKHSSARNWILDMHDVISLDIAEIGSVI
jgi:putative transposase